MAKNRREFLYWLAPFAACSLMLATRLLAQRPRSKMPNPPPPAEPSETQQQNAAPRLDRRAILEKHAKEFRQSLEQLYEKVGQVKSEVESLPAAEIFSVKIYKETEEIEKLAKRVKQGAKS